MKLHTNEFNKNKTKPLTNTQVKTFKKTIYNKYTINLQ